MLLNKTLIDVFIVNNVTANILFIKYQNIYFDVIIVVPLESIQH